MPGGNPYEPLAVNYHGFKLKAGAQSFRSSIPFDSATSPTPVDCERRKHPKSPLAILDDRFYNFGGGNDLGWEQRPSPIDLSNPVQTRAGPAPNCILVVFKEDQSQ
jgi:hypothetical protein